VLLLELPLGLLLELHLGLHLGPSQQPLQLELVQQQELNISMDSPTYC
jgi:hypothetical protein